MLESKRPRIYTRAMKIMRYAALALLLVIPVSARRAAAQGAPAAVKPAATRQMVLPSHGVMLYGIFYLAAGAGPHPTAVLFHGFPGYEQNLDIAQYLRAHGWNVLAMHYRGSWGVKGDFSFEHSAEDADVQVSYVLDPENARKYGIDTHRVIVIGHSMGGIHGCFRHRSQQSGRRRGAHLSMEHRRGLSITPPRRRQRVHDSG